MPAAAGDPVIARINSGKTTPEAVLPTVEISCPPHSSMKSRLSHKGCKGFAAGSTYGAGAGTAAPWTAPISATSTSLYAGLVTRSSSDIAYPKLDAQVVDKRYDLVSLTRQGRLRRIKTNFRW